jgi:hypothetical protein
MIRPIIDYGPRGCEVSNGNRAKVVGELKKRVPFLPVAYKVG